MGNLRQTLLYFHLLLLGFTVPAGFTSHRDRLPKAILPSRGNSSFRIVAACCSPPVCPALLHLISSRYLLSRCMDGMGRVSTIYQPSRVLHLCCIPIHVQMALQKHAMSSPHLVRLYSSFGHFYSFYPTLITQISRYSGNERKGPW